MIAMAKSNFRWGVNALVPSPAISHPVALANHSQNTLFPAPPPAARRGEPTYVPVVSCGPGGQQQMMPLPCSWQLHQAAHGGWAAAASSRSSSSEERPMPPTRCSRGRPPVHLLVLPLSWSPAALPGNGRREVQKASGDAVTGAG